MNKVVLIGRLTREPDVKTTNSDKLVARYTLAVDRQFKRGESSTDFPNCVAFGKGAEFAQKYLHKGTKIAVSGYIKTSSFTNANGEKVYATDVCVEEQEFAESKKDTVNAEFVNVDFEDDGLPFK